jgi:transcriptional regulator with XRE-family HTH domain
MEAGLYSSDFSQAFSKALQKTGASCYEVSQYSQVDQAYLSRLRSGEKDDPSAETIMRICLGFAHCSPAFSLWDAERLFNSVGRSLMPRRSHRYG